MHASGRVFFTGGSCHKSAPKSCGLSDLASLATLASLVILASLDCLARLGSLASLPSLASLASPVSLTDEAGLHQDLVSNHVGLADLASLAIVAILASLAWLVWIRSRFAGGWSPARRLREALGTGAPIDHLRLIDLEPRVVGGGQAGGCTDGAVDIDGFPTDSADEVVVIVADAVFVERGGFGGLDAPNEAFFCQHTERVVDGLF